MDTTLSALHTLSHLNLTSPRKLGHFVYEETEAQKCSVTCTVSWPLLDSMPRPGKSGVK